MLDIKESRSAATKIALMEAAETLFGRSGIEGVSVRQIGAAIGSANPSIVAYHFGTKEMLVKSIYEYRLVEIDRRRREILESERLQNNLTDTVALLRILWLPLFEQTDPRGDHSYARFLDNAMRSGQAILLKSIAGDCPATVETLVHLRKRVEPSAAKRFDLRWMIVPRIVLASLETIDRERFSPSDALTFFNDALSMAAAALHSRPEPLE